MLHELLLALLGYTGDLIVDEREHQLSVGLSPDESISDRCTFKLASDISFIEPSERDIIEKMITLGFYYRELDRFATKSRNLSWIRSGNEAPMSRTSVLLKEKMENQSVYRRAIANGIVEVLSVYRSAVLHMEQKLLSDPLPILATISQGLNKFFVLLPPLYELILEIERDGICGGRLLNLLHKRCHCGVPELQTCTRRLLWHGHQVMYNQLASWMVYGILHDQYGEFFICEQEGNLERDSSHTNMTEKLARMSVNDGSLSDWHLGFHISLDMLPEYIPMHVAESILFAGKAIRVLRNPSSAFRSVDALSHQARHKKLMGDELLPQSEADKIESMLKNLKESSEFHKRSFEGAVDSIRAIAASHLWQLVVVRADLNGHLRAIKDYFLLAKGDFFQSFLEESRQLMRLPPRQSTAEADLMVPFRLAVTKTISDDDKFFSRVTLRMPAIGTNIKSSKIDVSKSKYADGDSSVLSDSLLEMSLDGWDGIALEYSIDWPLQLFFTQEVLSRWSIHFLKQHNLRPFMGRYRRIFQYLLRLKRTQMELEKSWESVMQQDHSNFSKRHTERVNGSTSQQRRQCFRPMWRESRDFAELVDFHQEILDGIMKLCLQFCWKIENQESNASTIELERITEEFNKKSNSLYTILRSSRLAGSQRAPFLRRFLLRLNFNSYFEQTAQGVMNVIRPRSTIPVLKR
ncbi:Spc97/Spc98 [Cynara cardunculus var. scolymus]|uniref:Gamma-tubulin complex component n=1 Tax=Cynara cardunculus var. scolymus TaxID=59895 RepID=A0A103YNQ4_CYNCS|nr:Spc97/Spc98 [Cynara cardunculus var. scolymus]